MEQEFEFLKRIDPDPGNLIQGLQLTQSVQGYISDRALEALAEYFRLPVAEVEGVVSFYAKFKRTRPGKYLLTVCDGTACHVKKSSTLLEAIRNKLGITPQHPTTEDFLFSVETVSCLGTCGMAPVMLVNEEVHGQMTPQKLDKLIDGIIAKEREGAN